MPTAVTSLTVKSAPQFVQPSGNTLYPRTTTDLFQTGLTFGTGTGLGLIDRLVVQRFAIAAADAITIDLQAGAYSSGSSGSGNIVDLNGAQVTFARLKYLSLRLIDAAAGATAVTLLDTVSHGFPGVGGVAVAAGTGSGFEGPLVWCNPTAAGEVVTNSSTDILSIVGHASLAATVVLILGGCAS